MEGVVTPVNIIAFIVVLVIAAAAAYVYKNGVPAAPSGNPAQPDSEDADVGRHCQKKVLKMFKSFGCELSKDGKTLKSDQPIPHGLGRRFTLADATRAVIDMAVDQQMNASATGPPREPPSRAAAARPAQGPPPGLGIPDAPPVPEAADAYDAGGIGVGGALPAGFQMSEEEMAKYAAQPN